MIRRLSVCLLAIAAVAASAVSTGAQGQIRLGTLECYGRGGMTFVVGSVHEFDCTFRPDGGFPGPESYRGVVRRVGLDIGFTDSVSVGWIVLAPTNRIGRGELSGTYVGAAANASVGIGLGGNALVGGSNNTFALQPLSVQGQTGLNVAAGIAQLELYGR
jgi:hypothetical protein